MTTDSRDSRATLLRLQELLLPTSLPVVGCTEAAAAYRPHNDELRLGGDWYDLIDLPERNEIVAIVGDVVGHGLEQITVMGQLRAASSALARVCHQPHEILAALDDFAAQVPTAVMTTMAVLVLDGSATARLASAGHPPLLHLPEAGGLKVVEAGRRPPLTIKGASATATFQVGVNDLLVLYTDGVIERRQPAIDAAIQDLGAFVRQRFTEPCRDIANAIVSEFAAEADDDVAVMVLRPLHQVPGSPFLTWDERV